MILRGWFATVFALLVWGVTFANTRALLDDFSSLEIMIVRFVMAWIVLGAIGLFRREPHGCKRQFSWKGELLFAAMGLTGVLIYQLLENCAIYYTNAGNVAMLVSFGPIVTAVLARIWSRDHSLSWRIAFGSIVAIAGVAILSSNEASAEPFKLHTLGNLLALCAMISWSVYSVLIDKANALELDIVTTIRKIFGWTLILMIPLVLFGTSDIGASVLDGAFRVSLCAGENLARFSTFLNWINLVFLGVFASAISFIAWSRACSILGVVKTTITLYSESIIGVGFAALFLGERPTPLSLAGCLIIIIGVAIANKPTTMECN